MARKCLTAEEIFIINNPPSEWVSIPEWKNNGEECGCYCSALDAAWKERFESAVSDSNGKGRIGMLMAGAMVCAAVDSDGKRIFVREEATNAEIESATQKLSTKNGNAVVRFWKTYRRINAVTDADVEELAKN